MALPGKLTIGFLQEDNPVKAFFRIRPAVTLEEGGYQTVVDAVELFPEDGYIRIVPDKNELTQFKSRMRSLGRYCALDLRKYLSDNEKIRPNKNYGVSTERNTLIVYSDAICEVPSDVLAEVLDAQYVFVGEQVTLRAERPGTRTVLVRREGCISGPWVWTDAADVQGCLLLSHAPDCPFVTMQEADVAHKMLTLTGANGGDVVFMIDPDAFGLAAQRSEPPAQPVANDAPQPIVPITVPAPVPAPPAPVVATEPEVPAQPDAPVPVAPIPPLQPVAPAPPVESLPEVIAPIDQDVPAMEKPWIQKTEMPRPRAIAGRLSLRDQALFAQSGINPRKGRSLSEVVDEQWRKSRYDQLGHPVPASATGRPVISPIERAVVAVQEAFQLPEARAGLLSEMLSDEALSQALADCLNLRIEHEAGVHDKHLEEIESDRLKLLTEIDALRQQRAEMKAQLMNELRQTHRQEVLKYDEKIAALKSELERNEDAARSAQKAAEAARDLLGKTSEQLEHQMLSHLMTGRAIELVMHMNDKSAAPAQHPSLYEPTAGALISDLRVQLESAGFALNNDDAVSLLASMFTGGMVIVSGPTGSGKSQLVRQLAAALGLTGPARRFAEVRSTDAPEVKELLDICDGLTPCILLIDDINLTRDDEAVNGAIRLQEEARAKGLPLCLMLTVQDAPDGRALPMRLLARAFFIRLDQASADARWKPPELLPASPDHAVSLSAIRDILKPEHDLEGEVESRLNRFRQQLEKLDYCIDRRTLNELWSFCASVAHTGREGGLQALDRALATRALPAMLASMALEQLMELPKLLCDMPQCMKLMEQPLPLPPL